MPCSPGVNPVAIDVNAVAVVLGATVVIVLSGFGGLVVPDVWRIGLEKPPVGY